MAVEQDLAADQEAAKGMRLAAVAVASAVITATVVIGAGQFWIGRSVQSVPVAKPVLIRTIGQRTSSL